MENNNNNNQNENLDLSGEYGSKGDFSKAGAVMLQVRVVEERRSQEMREGYSNFDKFGNKIYIPDSRKAFISSVIALRNLLKPEIGRDKAYQEKERDIFEKELEAIEVFGIFPTVVDGSRIIELKDSPKYIPHLDEATPIGRFILRNNIPISKVVEYPTGIYNRCHHNYQNYLVKLYDELFAELNDLIDRNNYFDEGISY